MLQVMLRDCSALCTCATALPAAPPPLPRPARLFAGLRSSRRASSTNVYRQPRSPARLNERTVWPIAAASSAATPLMTDDRTDQAAQAAASAADAMQSAELPHDTASITTSEAIDSSGSDSRHGCEPLPEKKKRKQKKKAPWPQLIVANAPLPADPEAWQNAAVLVDKPLTWTSFDVCGKLRGALKIKKVGHAGTLDPQATGLLIVCIGKGCKQVDTFVAMEKAYSGTLRLGEATPSFDAETKVSHTADWRHITDADLAAARDSFLGDTSQLPPMYSAVRIKGQRLYLAARAGTSIEREPRNINISEFELWRHEPGDQNVHFRVRCSKGTYIRALAADLGEALGSAAHLVALRREAIGEHHVQDAWQLPDLVAAINAERATRGVPAGVPLSAAAEYNPAEAANT